MTFREEIQEKVPEDIQRTPEFNVFLNLIKKENIDSTNALKSYLKKEMDECREWMKQNQKQSVQGTMRRHLVRCSEKLDFLQLVEQKILKYL